MKQYYLLLLSLTVINAWSIGQSGSAKDASGSEQKSDESLSGAQSQVWEPELHPYYRIPRGSFRRELFGKRSGKSALSEEGKQRLAELVELARSNNELMLSNDDNELYRIVNEPDFWARLNDFYRYVYGSDSFQRERRRRRTQRELFG